MNVSGILLVVIVILPSFADQQTKPPALSEKRNEAEEDSKYPTLIIKNIKNTFICVDPFKNAWVSELVISQFKRNCNERFVETLKVILHNNTILVKEYFLSGIMGCMPQHQEFAELCVLIRMSLFLFFLNIIHKFIFYKTNFRYHISEYQNLIVFDGLPYLINIDSTDRFIRTKLLNGGHYLRLFLYVLGFYDISTDDINYNKLGFALLFINLERIFGFLYTNYFSHLFTKLICWFKPAKRK
jgi:hypothetical protein